MDLSLHIDMPTLRGLVKDFVAVHKNMQLDELVELLDLLYSGTYDDEKQFAGKLLQYYPKLRTRIAPVKLDDWLDNLIGWSQVDSLCQSVFTDKNFIDKWPAWEEVIRKFSQNDNINKRRASLVLLTGPVRQSDDMRFPDLAFKVIDHLKSEKDILISKAISWLLRAMIKHHKSHVAEYLHDNENLLPKIAVRETRRKLETGRK